MAQSGSAFATSSNCRCASWYQKSCSSATPRVKRGWTAGVQETGNETVPRRSAAEVVAGLAAGAAAMPAGSPPMKIRSTGYIFIDWIVKHDLAPDRNMCEKESMHPHKGAFMISKNAFLAGLLALSAAFASALGADTPAYGPELQGFPYPYPAEHFDFSSQRETLHMAYMDVRPKNANGRTAALLHGKNFCAATWKGTIDVLAAAGYRVIAPDQIGFCKSSKPERYQYTFQQLARNTHALLASLGIKTATLIAHSTGGMIAVRYALMYPTETEQLVLV